MGRGRLLSLLLAGLSALSLLPGCAGGARPSTPSTFVAAWTVSGGQVRTIESNDGIVWRNYASQNLQGNASESDAGPALAHDGGLNWMLMWPNPRGLDYKTGIGGVPLSGQGGVTWEPQPIQGRLPFTALGGRPVGSPALAHGNDRWVVAFRTAGTGNRLRLVRSQPGSATAWEPARDMEVAMPGGVRNVSTQRNPALAFGQGTFVLVHRGQSDYIASTSPDGIAWTDRGPIARIADAEDSDPAISFANGSFYVALRKILRDPRWFGSPPATAEIHRSADGITWTRIADQAGYFALGEFGPGFAFGDFGNNVCKAVLISQAVAVFPNSVGFDRGIQSWSGVPPAPHTCMNPSLLLFSPSEAAGEAVAADIPMGRTALAFGRTSP